jgi:hypothetical protein
MNKAPKLLSMRLTPECLESIHKIKREDLSHFEALIQITNAVRGLAGVIAMASEHDILFPGDISEAAWKIRDEMEVAKKSSTTSGANSDLMGGRPNDQHCSVPAL